MMTDLNKEVVDRMLKDFETFPEGCKKVFSLQIKKLIKPLMFVD